MPKSEHRKQILSAKNISKSFSKAGVATNIVDNFNITLYAGETTALIGPSGCGKSTLLNILCGLLGRDSGSINPPPHTIPYGYVQQQDALLPWKTVHENCALPLMLRKIKLERRNAITALRLKALNLQRFATYYPHQISGGMRQKATLARAMIENPPLLYLDEPFRSLDGITKTELYRWFLDLQIQYRFAALLVTHDPHEAVQLANTIIICTQSPLRIHLTIDPTQMGTRSHATLVDTIVAALKSIMRQ